MTSTKKLRIYTDFDATISINDVADTLFAEYAITDWKQPIKEWKEGLISSKELYLQEFAIVRITAEQLHQFCDDQPIDQYFAEFTRYCQTQNYPISVLSDGMDYYIKRILKNNGLDFLHISANSMRFISNDQIEPLFPHFGKGCTNCANCKGYHIKKEKKEDELIVFIGDGNSDICGIKQSDIIFAKDDLEKYCIAKKTDYYKFNNFKDVLDKFKRII